MDKRRDYNRASPEERQGPVDGSVECDCPAKTCQPQNNVGHFCWRTGCPIYKRDFAHE